MTKDHELSDLTNKTTMMITFNYPPQIGGIETLVHDIVGNYPGRVIVLAPRQKGCEDFDRVQKYETVRVLCPSSSLFRIPFFFLQAFLICRKNQIHHIQSANIFPAVVSMLISRLFKISYSIFAMGKEVYVLNTALRSKMYRRLFQKVLCSADRILSISDFTSGEVLKLGVKRERIFKIPSGIDTKALDKFDSQRFLDFKNRVTRELRIENRQIILTIARLVERKGQDYVIRAMQKVALTNPQAVYIVVGGGPERQRLEHLVDELGLREYVKFAGRVPDEDIVCYYRFAQIFILASRLVEATADVEGFGQVFLEANYCGLPVIGGRSGGIVDSVEHGKTGFLVDPEDAEDIARAIVVLLCPVQLARVVS